LFRVQWLTLLRGFNQDPVLGTAGGWSALVKVAEERRGSTLRTTCRALLAYGRTLLRGDRQRLRRADALLRRSLAAAAAAAEEGDDSGAAFLRGDMFAHFVRRYFLDLLQPAVRTHRIHTHAHRTHRTQRTAHARMPRMTPCVVCCVCVVCVCVCAAARDA
jgi:hypothetical protein